MESPAVRTTVVVASVRGGRLAPDVAGWFTALAGLRDDLELDVIDLADHELPGSLDAQDPVALALAPGWPVPRRSS